MNDSKVLCEECGIPIEYQSTIESYKGNAHTARSVYQCPKCKWSIVK